MTFNNNGYGNGADFSQYPQLGDIFDNATSQWFNIKYQNQDQFNNDVVRAIARFGAAFVKVGSQFGETTTMIGENKANITSSATAIKALQNICSSLQSQFNALSEGNDQFKQAVNDTLNGWAKQLASLRGYADSINKEVADQGSRITKIEGSVDPDRINTAVSKIEAFNSQLKASEEKLTEKITLGDSITYNAAKSDLASVSADLSNKIATVSATAKSAADTASTTMLSLSSHSDWANKQHTIMSQQMQEAVMAEQHRATDSEKSLCDSIGKTNNSLADEVKTRIAEDLNVARQAASDTLGLTQKVAEEFTTTNETIANNLIMAKTYTDTQLLPVKNTSDKAIAIAKQSMEESVNAVAKAAEAYTRADSALRNSNTNSDDILRNKKDIDSLSGTVKDFGVRLAVDEDAIAKNKANIDNLIATQFATVAVATNGTVAGVGFNITKSTGTTYIIEAIECDVIYYTLPEYAPTIIRKGGKSNNLIFRNAMILTPTTSSIVNTTGISLAVK